MNDGAETEDARAGRRDYVKSRRLDVVTEILKADPDTGEVEMIIRPDPRRYEGEIGMASGGSMTDSTTST